jgi:hypothetical protein
MCGQAFKLSSLLTSSCLCGGNQGLLLCASKRYQHGLVETIPRLHIRLRCFMTPLIAETVIKAAGVEIGIIAKQRLHHPHLRGHHPTRRLTQQGHYP